MSTLRAKCPDCRGYTAVALGPDYQCHACGREFAAGLVRVPRAWGAGGEAMAESAQLDLPYPEAAVVDEDSLGEQTLALAAALPERPLVLGGCCCVHIGPVEALASRHERLGLVWLDAHGDLNTPETSPSGNAWGMPLRMILESGFVRVEDTALVGARNLDPPEVDLIERIGLATGDAGIARALQGTGAVYVALDCDVLEPGEIACFMPEPGGPSIDAVEELLRRVARESTVVGLGLSGLRPDPASVDPLRRLCAAAGL